MNSRLVFRWIVLASLVAAAGGAGGRSALAAPARDSDNLLVNGGFESPFVKQCCRTEPGFEGMVIDEIQVANGWHAWWYPPGIDGAHPEYCGDGTPEECQAWHRPEWREAAPFGERIHGGGNAQKYFTFYSVHEAGVYQQVSGVPPGAQLRFSIYMHAWSTDQDSEYSSGQDSMGMKVGIDPTGDVNPWSPSIVWSPVHDAFDTYQLYTVEAVAQGSRVTVFTHSQPLWGYKHNDVYLDDASLIVVGDYAPPAPATATAPAAPATTLAGEPAATGPSAPAGGSVPVATWSQAPISPGAVTYTVQAGDTLWVIAARNGVSVDDLRRLNNITGSNIYIGQVLTLRVDSGPPTQAAAPASSPSATPAEVSLAAGEADNPVAPGATGDICVTVYADTNANGGRDASDGREAPAGLSFNLLRAEGDSQRVVGGYRTTGAGAAYCFPGLRPADYQLVFTTPAGYAVTTSSDPRIPIVSGSAVNVEIGLAPAEVVAAARARTHRLAATGLGLATLLAAYGISLIVYRRRLVAHR